MFYRKKIDNINIVSTNKSYIKKIGASLHSLKKWSNHDHKKVSKLISTILIQPKEQDYNTVLAKEKIWLVGFRNFASRDFDIPYMASLLIHEAHHVAQYLSGHKNYGQKAERSAYLKQRNFLKKIKYDYAVNWLDDQYKKQWWKVMDKQSGKKSDSLSIAKDYKNKKLKIKELN